MKDISDQLRRLADQIRVVTAEPVPSAHQHPSGSTRAQSNLRDATRNAATIYDYMQLAAPTHAVHFQQRIDELDRLAARATDEHGKTVWRLRCRLTARYLRSLAKKLVAGKDARPPMTNGQKRLWGALKGRAMTGKELAGKDQLDTSEETVRSWVRELRRAGYGIENRRGRGYYRPDAPPDDVRSDGEPT